MPNLHFMLLCARLGSVRAFLFMWFHHVVSENAATMLGGGGGGGGCYQGSEALHGLFSSWILWSVWMSAQVVAPEHISQRCGANLVKDIPQTPAGCLLKPRSGV